MLKFEILEKLIKVIRICIINSKCKVRYNQKISDAFYAESGLRQGNALSLMLFNKTLESIVSDILETNLGVRIQEINQMTIVVYWYMQVTLWSRLNRKRT